MIQALLFDFGGVITSSPFEAFNRFEARRGLPRDFIRSVNAQNGDSNAWARLERAEIGGDAFDREFAAESERLGHLIPGAEVLKLLSGALRPNMVALLKEKRAQFKLGCLTNNVRSDLAPSDEIKAVMALFHVVIESSKCGLRKPDPRIYALACDTLGVPPHEIVYLDDLGINLKPARAMGMQTIKVVSEDQAIADLEAALGSH